MLFIMGFAQIPQNLSKIFNGTIRSAGHKYAPMMISFTGIWLVRVALCCLSGWVFHWDITALWWAIALDQLVRVALSAIFFWKKTGIPYHTNDAARSWRRSVGIEESLQRARPSRALFAVGDAKNMKGPARPLKKTVKIDKFEKENVLTKTNAQNDIDNAASPLVY